MLKPEIKNNFFYFSHLVLTEELVKTKNSCPEIPLIINGEEIKTGIIGTQVLFSLN